MTYLTPRHLYLASAGVAVLMAVGCESLWRVGRSAARGTAALLGGVLLAGQLAALLWAVAQWNDSARLSEKMVRDVEREALSAPVGTLFILGAPWRPHTPWIGTYRWAFALPFVLEPPFMSREVAARASTISRPEVYCCPVTQWLPHVRDTVSAWLGRTDRPPVVALAWASPSGELIRRTELEHPELRYQAEGAFDFPGGALIVGVGSSPPGNYLDTGCDQVLVNTGSTDAPEKPEMSALNASACDC